MDEDASACSLSMEVGYASTRRGTCLVCSKPIVQRALQVGVEIDDPEFGVITKYQHAGCATMPGDPTQLRGFEQLESADKELLIAKAQHSSASSSGDGRAGGGLHIDRSAIPSIALDSEFSGDTLQGLQQLGVQVYDENELERGIIEQAQQQIEEQSGGSSSRPSIGAAAALTPKELAAAPAPAKRWRVPRKRRALEPGEIADEPTPAARRETTPTGAAAPAAHERDDPQSDSADSDDTAACKRALRQRNAVRRDEAARRDAAKSAVPLYDDDGNFLGTIPRGGSEQRQQQKRPAALGGGRSGTNGGARSSSSSGGAASSKGSSGSGSNGSAAAPNGRAVVAAAAAPAPAPAPAAVAAPAGSAAGAATQVAASPAAAAVVVVKDEPAEVANAPAPAASGKRKAVAAASECDGDAELAKMLASQRSERLSVARRRVTQPWRGLDSDDEFDGKDEAKEEGRAPEPLQEARQDWEEDDDDGIDVDEDDDEDEEEYGQAEEDDDDDDEEEEEEDDDEVHEVEEELDDLEDGELEEGEVGGAGGRRPPSASRHASSSSSVRGSSCRSSSRRTNAGDADSNATSSDWPSIKCRRKSRKQSTRPAL